MPRLCRIIGCRPGPVVALAQAVPGVEVSVEGAGKVYVIETDIAERAQQWAVLCGAFREAVEDTGSAFGQELARQGLAGQWQAEDVVFFDLETTGLSSTPLFLIGAMVWEAGTLVTRQYFGADICGGAGGDYAVFGGCGEQAVARVV